MCLRVVGEWLERYEVGDVGRGLGLGVGLLQDQIQDQIQDPGKGLPVAKGVLLSASGGTLALMQGGCAGLVSPGLEMRGCEEMRRCRP